MSAWHRDHPELVGTDADPWVRSPGYRRAVEQCRCGVCTPCEDRAEDARVALSTQQKGDGDA